VSPSHLRMETDPVLKGRVILYSEYRTVDKVYRVILLNFIVFNLYMATEHVGMALLTRIQEAVSSSLSHVTGYPV
jgi:hypothetical protein